LAEHRVPLRIRCHKPVSPVHTLLILCITPVLTSTSLTLYTLHFGPKPAIIACSGFILVGNWIRYGGTRANNFPVVVFGQIIIGFAQPFVLAAPTRYSDLWFSDRGRISATAVASLANPFGGALGQLIGPLWAENPSDVPNLVLYVSIISTIAALPSFFIPSAPPTPPSASAAVEKPHVFESLRALLRNRSFWIIFATFSTYVGAFNAISSLLNQIMGPYGSSEDEAGIGGAILIVVGLVAAAIASPIIDRTKKYLLMIKVCVPLIGLSYLVFYWAPQSLKLPFCYVFLAIMGASSFVLLPVTLEYLVEVTWPASPAVTSVIAWAGGQLVGGVTIVIMDALKDTDGSDGPKNNMNNALIFLAVAAMVAIVPPMLLGMKRFGTANEGTGRLLVDQRREAPGGNVV
jgi:MFS family permease